MQTSLSARPKFVCLVAFGVAFGLSIASAQQSGESDPLARSVQELTRELRALRVTVEASGHNQLQGQVLGLHVTLQQQRVALAAGRLDSVRRQLEEIMNQSSEMDDQLSALETRIPAEMDAERRRQLEGAYRDVKLQLDRLASRESRIKRREVEFQHAADSEEQQWREIVARLERLLERRNGRDD